MEKVKGYARLTEDELDAMNEAVDRLNGALLDLEEVRDRASARGDAETARVLRELFLRLDEIAGDVEAVYDDAEEIEDEPEREGIGDPVAGDLQFLADSWRRWSP